MEDQKKNLWRVILSGIAGGLATLIFALALIYLMSSIFPGYLSLDTNSALRLLPAFLAPVAGGFLAGLLAKEKAKQAGWIAGSLAGIVMLSGWVWLMGFGFQVVLRGIVVFLVVTGLTRAFAGFAKKH